MKTKLIIIVIFFSCLSFLYSQEKLNSIKTPTSPAASILGMQPTTVLSPKSYQALETALYSNFVDDNKTVIPNDFSLEFTPYWFTDHKLELIDYLYPKNFLEQIKRSSSFSVASTQNFILGDSTKTNGLAFGYRASFFLAGDKDKEKIESLKTKLNANQRITSQIAAFVLPVITTNTIENGDELFSKLKPIVNNVLKEHKISKELSDKFITELEAVITKVKYSELNDIKVISKSIDDTYDTVFVTNILYDEFKDYIKNRYGLYLDIAYANFLNFPSNDFEYSFVPAQSVWLTPSYRFTDKLKYLKLIGVIKYEWNNTEYFGKYFPDKEVYKNNFDYGIAVAGEFNKFSIQFELVGRSGTTEIAVDTDENNNILYRKDKSSDLQYIGTLNYNLTDQIILSYSLGKKFDLIHTSGNNIVSLLSLNFGFGTPTKKDIK